MEKGDSLEVEHDDEGEWDDERDDCGGDHEVERHLGVLVPRDGAPPGLLDHLAGVLVGEVVHLERGSAGKGYGLIRVGKAREVQHLLDGSLFQRHLAVFGFDK